MKRITRSHRGVAFLISLCILLSNTCWPVGIAVAIDDVSGLCEHHSEHTEDCGYAAGVLCAHEHDDGCYSLECTHEHTEECYSEAEAEEADLCGHVHGEDCFVLSCSHEHDEECGYTEGRPCEFVCVLCGAEADEPAVMAMNDEIVPLMGVAGDIMEAHRIKDAIDPDDTVVNFFDYWTLNQNRSSNNIEDSQYTSDFRSMWGYGDVGSGINKGHVLLFAGYFGLDSRDESWNNGSTSGNWNAWTGDNGSDGMGGDFKGFDPNNPQNPRFKPYQGIVANTLENGYPRLDLAGQRNPGSGNWWGSGLDSQWEQIVNYSPWLRTESLQYLFDPDYTHDGKASYKNVKGLFRMNDQGYYYYNSKESFAELNASQGWGQKTSLGDDGQNTITLYDEPWRYVNNRYGNGDNRNDQLANSSDNAARNNAKSYNTGQFFPFNHWADLFSPAGGTNVTQDHFYLQSQAEAGQAMNHYFGMTVTTKFQQPRDGMISPSTPMTFEFSGDDDVWIFIDDVLVGDIGGIHLPDAISINFSTGDIIYTALNVPEPNNKITHMNTTIKGAFEAALGKTQADELAWDDTNPTFANGSIHTLKFYYMERGNDVSNCSISFNLEPILKDRIRKVNEDGGSLDSAMFELYEADVKAELKNTDTFKNTNWHTANEFQRGNIVAGNLRSNNNGDGYYELVDENGEAIDFTKYKDGSYFILYEAETPAGYRLNKEIVLQYHYETNTFTVVNMYETGAYASFVAKWTQHEAAVNYAKYAPGTGTLSQGERINGTGNTYDNTKLRNGLSIVVPVFKQTDELNAEGTFRRWLPMYGSNTLGWQTITDSYQSDKADENEEVMFVRDLALAAFLQMTGTNYRDWYLTWDNKTNRLTGDLENLPGDATRYVVNNSVNPDLNLATLFISADELATLLGESLDFEDDIERYNALKEALTERIGAKRDELGDDATDEMIVKAILDEVIKEADYKGAAPFKLLFTDNFSRIYRTALYVPNERRELRVRKVDGSTDEGLRYINGAVFAIFEKPADAVAFPGNVEYRSTEAALNALKAAQEKGGSGIVSFGETATVKLDNSDGSQEGLLIFREDEDNTGGAGYAHIYWSAERDTKVLWLKEIYSPDGYARNTNLVRIEVGNLAIYANATGYDANGNILTGYAKGADGIRVYAALGKLTQTLVKYALNNRVDITLRDILITLQNGESEENNNGALNHDTWKDATDETFDLHFGLYSDVLTSQYGQHTYEQQLPWFIASDGYTRIMPRQNQKNFSANSADGKAYYKALAAELYEQLYENAMEKGKEEVGGDLTPDQEAQLKDWVNAKVKGIIDELKELHSYDAKMDTLTNNGKPIDLDGLFGLMNVVEVTNNVIPVSLTISKEVNGPAQPGDIYRFNITLEDTKERKDKDPTNEISGEYHAYIHPTDHQVIVYDQHGNPIQETDHITGELLFDKEGNPIYQTHHCGPGDHTKDDDHVHLVVDENGDGKVIHTDKPNEKFTLELKDGWSFAVVGLPQGAKFTVTEEIYSPSVTQYETSTERRNDMRPYGDGIDYKYDESKRPDKTISDDPDKNPEIVVKRTGRTVSGFLQTALYAWDMQHSPNYQPFPVDPQEINHIVIPATEVKFINTGLVGLPDTGGIGTMVYWITGIAILMILAGILLLESRKQAADN